MSQTKNGIIKKYESNGRRKERKKKKKEKKCSAENAKNKYANKTSAVHRAHSYFGAHPTSRVVMVVGRIISYFIIYYFLEERERGRRGGTGDYTGEGAVYIRNRR